MLAKTESNVLDQEYHRIMAYACDQPNDATYACMLASWQAGNGMMPDDFGLGDAVFDQLLASHFPGLDRNSLTIPGRSNDTQRNDECDDVFKLLLGHRAQQTESEIWMARIVAMACQGQDHLWQDMGLWSRSQLSELLMRNFHSLAVQNVKNMKWKKFLYKQLCITEGIYTCRAPSCEVCADYTNCFGSEE
ncbi:nitrogen fixation protein NifQ [Kaarinaea lacus]